MMKSLVDISYYPKALLIPQNLNNGSNKQDDHVIIVPRKQLSRFIVSAAKSGGGFSLNSVLEKCQTCAGQGAVECSGCKGTGRNKKNGNIFERWKCFDCQGFGLRKCPECGKGGLTPEQRGER